MLDRLNGAGDDGENRPEDHHGPTADQPEALGNADEDRPAGPDVPGIEPPAGSSDGSTDPPEEDIVPLDRDLMVALQSAGEDETVPLAGLATKETVAPAGLDPDNTVPLSGLSAEKTRPIEGLSAEKTDPVEEQTAPIDKLGAEKTVPLERSAPEGAPADGSRAEKTVALPGLDADKTVSIAGLGAEKAEGSRAEKTVALPGIDADKTVSIGGLGAKGASADGSRGEKTVAVSGLDADKTVSIGGLGAEKASASGEPRAEKTVALTGLGSDRTVAFEGLSADGIAEADTDRPAAAEHGGAAQPGGGWERLTGLGRERLRRGRERLASGAASGQIERLKAIPAGEKVERLRGWGDEHPVARRRLLIAVPSVAGLALLTGAVKAAEPKPKPKPTTSTRAVARPRPAQPAHPVEKTTVHTLPVQHKPIFTLDDYRRMTGAPPFPADAIALTIDDGPHPVWTPKILHLLEKYHAPALFCMIGNQVLGHEAVAQTVTKAGHQLANHTWSHPTSLAARTPDQVRQEIERAQAKIQDTTGYAPKMFRSPGGAWSPTVLQETAKAGLIPLDWDNDPRDWSRPGVPHITSKLLAARPGQILLCHDGGGDRSQTYAALSTVVPALIARGLRFVAL